MLFRYPHGKPPALAGHLQLAPVPVLASCVVRVPRGPERPVSADGGRRARWTDSHGGIARKHTSTHNLWDVFPMWSASDGGTLLGSGRVQGPWPLAVPGARERSKRFQIGSRRSLCARSTCTNVTHPTRPPPAPSLPRREHAASLLSRTSASSLQTVASFAHRCGVYCMYAVDPAPEVAGALPLLSRGCSRSPTG